MIVAYAGGVITFFVYPKEGGVMTFFSFAKGGSCVFVRCFADSYSPPPVEMMNGPLSDSYHPKIKKYVTWG